MGKEERNHSLRMRGSSVSKRPAAFFLHCRVLQSHSFSSSLLVFDQTNRRYLVMPPAVSCSDGYAGEAGTPLLTLVRQSLEYAD